MNYIDIEDRKRKKKLFTALYAGTILLILIACTAFLIAPRIAKEMPVQEQTKIKKTAVQEAPKQQAESIQTVTITEHLVDLQDLVEGYREAINSQSSEAELETLDSAISSKKAALQTIIDSSNANTADTNTARLISISRKAIAAALPEGLPVPVVKNAPTSTSSDVSSAYEARLRTKDDRIKQLQRELIVAGNTARSATADFNSESAKDAKFLSWALSSQSLELNKLKKENAALKSQISNLKRQ